jgi:hypothetical protein
MSKPVAGASPAPAIDDNKGTDMNSKWSKAACDWAARVKRTWVEAKTPRERVKRLWADKANRVVAVVVGLLLLAMMSSASSSNGYAGAGGHANPMGAWSESHSNGRVTHSEYSGVTVYSEN